jgi:hypothetical protein
MSAYRFVQDAYVGTRYYLAGDTASTADVGGALPTGWVPSVGVEPLDPAAITAVWNAGPQILGLVRQQWSNIPVSPPTIYWREGVGGVAQLTGAGAALGPKNFASRNGGALP